MKIATKFEDRGSSSPSTHEGEPSESLCDRLSRTRDTSQRQLRRIKIMRFRPANIRLINRRSNLPRLLLPLSSKNIKRNRKDKNGPTDSQTLTGSLHIRDLSLFEADADRWHCWWRVLQMVSPLPILLSVTGRAFSFTPASAQRSSFAGKNWRGRICS